VDVPAGGDPRQSPNQAVLTVLHEARVKTVTRCVTAYPQGDDRMTPSDDGLFSALRERGVSRRAFLGFCAAMAGTLAIPATYTPRIVAALAAAPRIPLVWLCGQGCGGDGEALLRASSPTVAELLLEVVSLDYCERLMAPAGPDAGVGLLDTMASLPDRYFVVVEGAVPLADDGTYALTGGRPFRDLVRDVCDGALATIAVGSCAFDGGLSGAAGGQTGAVGIGSIVGTDRLVNLPGCPANAENLTATLVHYVTFNELPARDLRGRPLFAYGGLVHNQCERRSHFEYGEFVQAWGDEAAQKGWCLYKMGCKGPETFANCPTIRYGGGASWPVKAGHGCIGCTMPAFWDAMSPFYLRLPSPVPFAPDLTVDQVGGAAVAGVAALTATHAVASYARERVAGVRERRRALPQATSGPDAPRLAVSAGDDLSAAGEARTPVDATLDGEPSSVEPGPVPLNLPVALEPAAATPSRSDDFEAVERIALETAQPGAPEESASPADALDPGPEPDA
jgi:hydrogenase small subunit